MKKPSKKRIDEVAEKMQTVFRAAHEGCTSPGWATLAEHSKKAWRALAVFALTDMQPADDYKMPPFMGEAAYQGDLARKLATKHRNSKLGVAGPKSCKVVRGKKVCK